jgi:hypothetical protein
VSGGEETAGGFPLKDDAAAWRFLFRCFPHEAPKNEIVIVMRCDVTHKDGIVIMCLNISSLDEQWR